MSETNERLSDQEFWDSIQGSSSLPVDESFFGSKPVQPVPSGVLTEEERKAIEYGIEALATNGRGSFTTQRNTLNNLLARHAQAQQGETVTVRREILRNLIDAAAEDLPEPENETQVIDALTRLAIAEAEAALAEGGK